jgi:hypothetical protein
MITKCLCLLPWLIGIAAAFEVDRKDLGFSITFPSAWREPVAEQVGTEVYHWTSVAPREDAAVLLNVIAGPLDPEFRSLEKFVPRWEESVVQQSLGKVKGVYLDLGQGRCYHLVTRMDDDLYMHHWLFLVEETSYALAATSSNSDKPDKVEVTRCLKSLVLKKPNQLLRATGQEKIE